MIERCYFGARVEELVKQRQIKVTDFYETIGISKQNYYDWKRRNQAPNAMTALKVARYFGVTVEYLLTGETNNPLQAKVDELQKKHDGKDLEEIFLEITGYKGV